MGVIQAAHLYLCDRVHQIGYLRWVPNVIGENANHLCPGRESNKATRSEIRHSNTSLLKPADTARLYKC